MSKMACSETRRKNRLAFELRYPAIPMAFDRRGTAISTFQKSLKSKLPHWTSENVMVNLVDDLESPSKQLALNHLRFIFAYEDPSSPTEFYHDSHKAIKDFCKIHPEISSFTRLGVRSISVFEISRFKSFDSILNAQASLFFSDKVPLIEDIQDCQLTINLKNAQYQVGPVKAGEPWVKQVFKKPENNVPEYGLGIDADSFITDFKANDEDALCILFDEVFSATIHLEEDILNSFKLLES